jgi:NAD(P)-dependent dehydrogenase (short-subunit alcohol dehydrogenase family)
MDSRRARTCVQRTTSEVNGTGGHRCGAHQAFVSDAEITYRRRLLSTGSLGGHRRQARLLNWNGRFGKPGARGEHRGLPRRSGGMLLSMSTNSKRAGWMQGRVALVTGAGSGIGRAIAARFLEEGASVLLTDVDRAAGDDACDELRPLGRVEFEVVDVSDETQVAAALARSSESLGRLDCVVNNAGFFGAFGSPVEELSSELWLRTLQVNLSSAFYFAKHGAPELRKRRGSILNVSSTRALMSEANTEAYAASKGGLSALTHALAISLGPEVRVNGIAPGWIATCAWKPRAQRKAPALRPEDHAQHPAGRVGRPEDVAALAAFLCSDEAGFITGQIVTVDGGMTRKMIYAE